MKTLTRKAAERWTDEALTEVFARANGAPPPKLAHQSRCHDCGKLHYRYLECPMSQRVLA